MSNLSSYLTTRLHQKLLAEPTIHAITNVNLFACPLTEVCHKAGRHARHVCMCPPCMYVSHTYLAKDRDMPEVGGHSYHACMPAMHVSRFSVCSAGIRMCRMLVATLVDTHVICLFRDQLC